MIKYLASIITLLYFLHYQHQVQGQGFQLAQSDDCGKITEDPSDPRTLVPWTASIFAKAGSRHPYKFLITGTVIGPYTILSIFAGAYGEPQTKNSKYFIPPAENHIIGVGLKSNDLNVKRDEYSQFSKVKFIVPYGNHNPDIKEYHFFLFHLEKPLDLTGPYVRSACIPVFLKTLPTSAYGHNLNIVQGGFSSSSGSLLATNVSLVEPQSKCSEHFKANFKGSSNEVLCGKPISDGNQNPSCTLYGSAPMVSVFNKRWFMLGITALIPKPTGNASWCNKNTVYIYGRITDSIDWLLNNLKCMPNNFSCGDGSCVSLTKICDRKTDCSKTALDEDGIFCRARKPCLYSGRTVECGVYGPCIKPQQICNGTPDCDDASDEQRCTTELGAETDMTGKVKNQQEVIEIEDRFKDQKITTKRCAPLQAAEGVIIECKDGVEGDQIDCRRSIPDTVAVHRCQHFYKSTYRLPSIEMKCQADGSWKPYRPFGCEVDCGILSNKIVAFIVNGQEADEENSYPWHTTLFYKKPGGDDHLLICGGTLVEKTILITAAHCVSDGSGLFKKSNYKVVLGAKSSNFSQNLANSDTQIFGVKNIWTPATYDRRTLQSDVAIMQLDREVKYGDKVRPACYLQQGLSSIPSAGTMGKVAGFGYNQNQILSKTLHFAELPIIGPNECKNAFARVPPLQTFCAGWTNGTSVCQGDSGGGLVVGEKIGTDIRYVLKGIVSHGEMKAGSLCDHENYAVFTHLDDYADWILSRLEGLSSRRR